MRGEAQYPVASASRSVPCLALLPPELHQDSLGKGKVETHQGHFLRGGDRRLGGFFVVLFLVGLIMLPSLVLNSWAQAIPLPQSPE